MASAVATTGSDVVQVQLQFQRDDRGRSLVTGSVQVPVALDCERCLEQVEHALVARVDAVLVRNDAAAEDVHGRDAIVLEDRKVSLAGLLEDDLLLSLPMVACDAGQDCPRRPTLEYGPGAEAESQQAALDGGDRTAHGPFAALRHLVESKPDDRD